MSWMGERKEGGRERKKVGGRKEGRGEREGRRKEQERYKERHSELPKEVPCLRFSYVLGIA